MRSTFKLNTLYMYFYYGPFGGDSCTLRNVGLLDTSETPVSPTQFCSIYSPQRLQCLYFVFIPCLLSAIYMSFPSQPQDLTVLTASLTCLFIVPCSIMQPLT